MNSGAVSSNWLEHQDLYRLLGIWPRINFLKEINQPKSPFSAGKAEDDFFVLKSYYSKIPSYLEIEREFSQRSLFVYGAPESGKTATSFQLAFTGLCGSRGGRWFPVYVPFYNKSDGPLNIQRVLYEIARALLAYLTLNIDEFRKLSDETLGAMVRSWIKFIDEGDALLTNLNANGLGSSRYSTEIEKRVQGKMKGIAKLPSLSREECLDLARKCIPDSFTSIRVILDLHTNSLSIDEVKDIKALADMKIFMLVFMSDEPECLGTLKQDYPNIQHQNLNWERTHIKGLLKIRLNQIHEDSIASWCDPEAKLTMPDDRLVKASEGKPASLLRIGNKVFEQFNNTGNKLSKKDLDDLLGP